MTPLFLKLERKLGRLVANQLEAPIFFCQRNRIRFGHASFANKRITVREIVPSLSTSPSSIGCHDPSFAPIHRLACGGCGGCGGCAGPRPVGRTKRFGRPLPIRRWRPTFFSERPPNRNRTTYQRNSLEKRVKRTSLSVRKKKTWHSGADRSAPAMTQPITCSHEMLQPIISVQLPW